MMLLAIVSGIHTAKKYHMKLISASLAIKPGIVWIFIQQIEVIIQLVAIATWRKFCYNDDDN